MLDFAKDDFHLLVFTDERLFSIFHAIKFTHLKLGRQLEVKLDIDCRLG
jgi:hypothetical protein